MWAFFTLLAFVASADPAEREEGDDTPPPRSILWDAGLSPEFSLHGFTHVSYVAERRDEENDELTGDNAFALGELDLYMVSRLSDKLSFLGELVFELEPEGAVVDIERVFVRYAISDALWLGGGRFHTPIGYWNPRFHHGMLLQPTIERPLPVRFEDHGGVLPAHGVGVEARGRLFRDTWSLDYASGLFNGRGAKPADVQGVSDLNDAKAPALQLSLTTESAGRIEFGSSSYWDVIPPDPAVPGREGAMDEWILGAHFVFEGQHLELIAEYLQMRHEDRASRKHYSHPMYYALAVWKPWKWKPYAACERLDLDESDPFFAELEHEERRNLIGVRVDARPFLAVKMELRRDQRPGESAHGLAVQVAYTF